MDGWSHFDGDGRPAMVDVGEKNASRRRALAEGWVDLPEAIYEAVKGGGVKKGDPVSVAELGGMMGAKRTPELIPLCHAIRLDCVRVRCELCEAKKSLRIECEARAADVTGVEMEALTGVSVAALVFYDMCKGLDKGMVIRDIRLLEKSGGKSGDWKYTICNDITG
jgi:cyclic pyranopterin phosphate synthase